MKRMKTQRSFPWKFLQMIVRLLAALLFDLKVYGRHHIPARGGVLIVSNHQSLLDPILLPVGLDRPLNYIAKSELFENRYFAMFLRSVLNAFPVRQGVGDVRAVKETIQRLTEGQLMNIYPEGARTKNGEIGPLQQGAALIIRRAQVPVVPAVIVGAFEAWPVHRKFLRCRPICIQFGPPMDLAGQERNEMMVTIDQTLRAMFDGLNKGTVRRGEGHAAWLPGSGPSLR